MTLRRIGIGAAALGLAAAGLGLVGPPAAEASCAGPQLSAGGQSSVPAPEARTDEGDELVYAVTAAEPVRVIASNLVDGCQDTYVTGPGCGATDPRPSAPTRPLTDLRLVLHQAGHRWTLAEADAPRPDLTLDLSAELPADARPGPATLELTSREGMSGSIRVRIG